MTRTSHHPLKALLLAGAGLLLAGAATLAAQSPDAPATTERLAAAVPAERLAELLAGEDPKTVPELRAMEQHVQDLVQRVLPATVSLPGASGVLVRRDDQTFVLCAAHVTLEADKRISIRTTDGDRLRGTSLGADHQSDVSLVRVDSPGEHPTAAIGRSSELRRGEWVLMLGHPSGLKPGRSAPVRLGRVLRVPERGYVVTDCTMQAGDSGGPLFDMQGRVVGINSRINRNLAMNMHAPVDAIVDNWSDLLGGKVTERRSRRGRGRGLGAPLTYGEGAPLFGEVPADSAAAKAGLRTGDRLFEIDGEDIDDRATLLRALRGKDVGDEVQVVVYRDGKGVELTLRVEREGDR